MFTYDAGEELFITVDGKTVSAGNNYNEISTTIAILIEDQQRTMLEEKGVIGNHTANYAAEQAQPVSHLR